MPDAKISIDPELEGLLQELAQQGESTLLQVPRKATLLHPYSRPPLPLRSDMSTLERHLLDTHKAELAFELREACLASLHYFEESAGACSPTLTATWSHEISSQWQPNRSTPDVSAPHSETRPEALLVRSLLEQRPSAPSTVLAAAARMLEETENTLIYSGLGLINQGHHSRAEKVLLACHEQTRSESTSAFCLLNLGYLSSMRSNPRQAMEWYRKSSATSFKLLEAVASWLINAIDSGESRDAVEAAACLDAQVPNAHHWVSEFSKRRASADRSTRLDGARKISLRLADREDSPSTRIARASL